MRDNETKLPPKGLVRNYGWKWISKVFYLNIVKIESSPGKVAEIFLPRKFIFCTWLIMSLLKEKSFKDLHLFAIFCM